MIGRHLLFDSLLENMEMLRDAKELETRFRRVFAAHSVSVLDFMSHTFQGHGGITGVFLLAESHASFHTWPEHGLICCDFFACGEVDLIAISEMLTREFAGKQTWTQIVSRGNDTRRL
jgi:S-adenosylmethionine decarboxylase